MKKPDFKFEQKIWDQGLKNIVGVDESGRGALAGPIVAAAVILPKEFYEIDFHFYDSKRISPKKRLELFKVITRDCLWSYATLSSKIIDKIGVGKANLIVLKKAILRLAKKIQIDFVLIDAFEIDCGIPYLSLIKGDLKSPSIAAASIIAKVIRDKFMIKISKRYPEYGFEKHKGYGTLFHREKIKELGPIANFHRFSFIKKLNY